MNDETKTLTELLSDFDHLKNAPKTRKIPRGVVAGLVLLLLAGGVVAVTVLLRQTTPTVTPVANVFTSGCAPLVQEGSMIIGPSITGFIVFDCGPAAAAFSVSAGGAGTYTFALSQTGMAAPWTAAFVVTGAQGSGISCEMAYSGVLPITGLTVASPSASVTVAATSYAYCLDYAGATSATAPAVTFTWTK